MTTQFYKFAVSLTQKLQCQAQCFIKIHKSIRKYRKLYLSNVYLYILSEEKIKYKISASKIKKIICSQNSSEFVLLSESKSILIDDLAFRQKFKKQLMNLNPNIQIVYVKQPLLDDYVEGNRLDEKEDTQILNLVRLRSQYEEFANNIKEKHFYQQYSSIDLIAKNQYYTLMTAQKKNEGKQQKKGFSFFKREKKELYTVKVYQKKLIGMNTVFLHKILRERKCLEQILSPYIPVLYKCMSSRSSIYCITEPYRGNSLKTYLQNETLTKSQFKSLLSQMVMALGQIHQCNLVYNNVNLQSIFMVDQGYILLNQFSKCFEVNEDITEQMESILKDCQPPQGLKDKMNSCWDWWNLGQLIYFIKQSKKWSQGAALPWQKEPQLISITNSLLQSTPSKRLGYRNDYHEVLGHAYFKNINKKQLATKKCEPLKKFFTPNPQKIQYYSDGEDWSMHDSYLEDYEFNRELE